MDDCIFCKIIAGELPTKKVSEGDGWVAFRDIAPKAPEHVLIVPKEHIRSLGEAQDTHKDMLGRLMLATREVAETLGIRDAYQVKVFSGENAGQTVFHLHLHLTGGWKEKQSDN
ncbi:MAG: histidine triad nucleotide-binding protein [Candidatus Chisholmbacteria bacterium]|nr:histidine triad nucleotide-binding protein [Candidatus Chisholmbacteria bacterium]